MFNSKSPFYIKPRLNLDLIRWGLLFQKAATEKRVKDTIPVLYDLTVKSQELYEQILEEEKIDAGYHKLGIVDGLPTKAALHHEEGLVKIVNHKD